ncbi:MAG: hypothetical protein LKH76_08640 [Acetobacter fabarum]|jgi:hypothetical protein|uniref:hypothetical protein n=1 Tax=Acetobacter fabarum TaxID=483199 RepID=UPI00242B933A|nr:hypothetical protein [Acetobacter fabarum]MCH4025029.1 hypothetical protein [Acetobacter fabarum]MCH4128609.1 hypothetical protein [Acetobacter fabarum]MCH4141820.1 hypothetical protein [Acetobacter fabarum]MCI1297617.1 hypothetical protein [Acetobacter fabarum]MCI1322978.1 hypothetical protein [Acetobacter fabarum]
MSILEMPVPSDVLTEVVDSTIFAQPERHRALLRDIREFLRSSPADATASHLAFVLTHETHVAGDNRRQVIREFFESYPEGATAGEILAQMEAL